MDDEEIDRCVKSLGAVGVVISNRAEGGAIAGPAKDVTSDQPKTSKEATSTC